MLPFLVTTVGLLSLSPTPCSASLPPSTYNSSSFNADELAPKFSIPLGSGKGTITETSYEYFPLVLFNYNSSDPFSRIMVDSWEEFLGDPNFPKSTTFLFGGDDGIDIPDAASDVAHLVAGFDALGDVLSSWMSSVMTITIDDVKVTRVDCFYGKCAWPDEEVSSTLVKRGLGLRQK